MKHVTLIAVEDEYDSTPGLAVKGTPVDRDGFMADRDGTLVAHDILEHQNGVANIGPLWDELEAMGAIWHVRGRWGDLLQHNASYHSPEMNIASDISRMFHEAEDDYVPPQHRFSYTHAIEPECTLTQILEAATQILEAARKSALSEIRYEGIDRAGETKAGKRLGSYLTEARHRFRIGYRKAVRRFGHGPQAYDQFRAIRDQVYALNRMVDFAGQEFLLSWGGGRALVKERHDPFDY